MRSKLMKWGFLLVISVAVFAADSQQWHLRHRRVRRIAPKVMNLLSAKGSMKVDFSANKVRVEDTPEVLKAVDRFILHMDVPLRAFVLDVGIRQRAFQTKIPKVSGETDVFGLGDRGWRAVVPHGRVSIREESKMAWRPAPKGPWSFRGKVGDYDAEARRLDLESVEVLRARRSLWKGHVQLEEGRMTAFAIHGKGQDVLLTLKASLAPRKPKVPRP